MNDDFFEGCEKVLQLSLPMDSERGLFELHEEDWITILDVIGAKILSRFSTGKMDSYVLSESSLFVWKDRFMIKTCGVTALLSALPTIKSVILDRLGICNFSNALYCRKSLLRPQAQKYPHNSPSAERDYLLAHYPDGKWVEFGHNIELSGWSIFLYDNKLVHGHFDGTRIELNMYKLDPSTFTLFSKGTYCEPETEMRKAAKIDKLVAGSALHDAVFDPYGYSVNGVRDSNYFTIHVTPQPSCSYASFESNLKLSNIYPYLKVLSVLKPGAFCLTIVCQASEEYEALSFINGIGGFYDFKEMDSLKLNDNLIYYCWF
ncbi:S-adenosylmethionine decarboxylase proenzyme [Thelohanellus kitauei]|uniref:S-adenosylmethionine decarboxylase proenzyme n=1 Tax=Thelohanellus kitauei TaxID=669202 RepID=A0A0C2MFE8_THEKT|nr:S-adenosylmethionine decarboxylase proenzyme [Thelohanellus kitauei]